LPCWIPLDLASKIDVAAAPLLFYDEDEELLYIVTKGRLFLPEHAVQHGTNSQYTGWAEQGYIAVTEGQVTDFDEIESTLKTDCAELNVQELPYDPWQATQLAGHMLAESAPMVEVRQTVQNMSEPMKTLQAWIIDGKVRHDDNPVMDWMMGNVIGHLDAKENIYPRKARPENKIDGPVAVITGLNRIIGIRDEDDAMPSDYSLVSV
jgi:phage terminase large subunit-like protein